MSKYKLVTVAKDQDFKMLSIDTNGLDNVTLVQIANNTRPLTQVYNEMLKETRVSKDADFVIFIHADAHVDLKHLVEHIEECAEKYEVMGLCGTEVINVTSSPLNWFTGSALTPQKRWGCVTHGELGNQISYFSNGDREATTDHEVACIDGVCIVFGPKALSDESLLFDEQFLFDLYDTDLSFQCLMQKRYKLGVLVEPSLQHYSVGRSILTDDFLFHEMDFRKKWRLELPDKSRIQMLAQSKNEKSSVS